MSLSLSIKETCEMERGTPTITSYFTFLLVLQSSKLLLMKLSKIHIQQLEGKLEEISIGFNVHSH